MSTKLGVIVTDLMGLFALKINTKRAGGIWRLWVVQVPGRNPLTGTDKDIFGWLTLSNCP